MENLSAWSDGSCIIPYVSLLPSRITNLSQKPSHSISIAQSVLVMGPNPSNSSAVIIPSLQKSLPILFQSSSVHLLDKSLSLPEQLSIETKYPSGGSSIPLLKIFKEVLKRRRIRSQELWTWPLHYPFTICQWLGLITEPISAIRCKMRNPYLGGFAEKPKSLNSFHGVTKCYSLPLYPDLVQVVFFLNRFLWIA